MAHISGITSVLEEDPDLGAGLSPERLRHAQRTDRAAVMTLEEGDWHAADDSERARGGFGLLVLSGLLVRRVGREGRFGAELLGPGDLLRPWQHDGEGATLPFTATWRVTSRSRLAILDLDWARRMAPLPEVAGELMGRCLLRSRRLATTIAINHHQRIDHRLELLLWDLADRHGRVTPEGVRLELPLTHETLAAMVAARRPSVTVALGELEQRGALRRERGRIVLLGDAPAEPQAA